MCNEDYLDEVVLLLTQSVAWLLVFHYLSVTHNVNAKIL